MYIRVKRDQSAFLFIIPYLIVLSGMVDVLASGRDVSVGMFQYLNEEATKSFAGVAFKRLATICILLACFHRLWLGLLNLGSLKCTPLLIAGIGYWVGSVFLSGFLAFEPHFQHDYIYSVLIFSAVFFQSKKEGLFFIESFRNSLILLLACSLLVVFIKPSMVIEYTYVGESLFNLPRFLGLSNHAITMAYSCIFLVVCLAYFPLKSRSINRFFISISVFFLFWAQSKSAIAVFFILVFIYCFYKINHRKNIEMETLKFISLNFWIFFFVLLSLYIFASFLLFFDMSLLRSLAGDFTGRDQVWSMILQAEYSYKLFGYGVNFFDYVDEVYFVNGHNQMLDTVIKSGQVGLYSLLVYLGLITLYSIMLARESRGLTMIFMIIILLKSFTEVPIGMYGYNSEFLNQIVVVVAILIYSSHLQWRRPLFPSRKPISRKPI